MTDEEAIDMRWEQRLAAQDDANKRRLVRWLHKVREGGWTFVRD